MLCWLMNVKWQVRGLIQLLKSLNLHHGKNIGHRLWKETLRGGGHRCHAHLCQRSAHGQGLRLNYSVREPVDLIVVGEPKDMRGNESESMTYIRPFLKLLKKELPDMPVEMYDERFSSSIAHREMIAGGFKKKTRQEKGKADEMAAVIILTSYLESRR